MGLIKFKIGSQDLLTEVGVQNADFVTFDGRVVPASARLNGSSLECVRRRPDSSKLRLLCNIGTRRTVLQSTSLPEVPDPYCLELELARGELSRLRNFYHLWTGAGLRTSPRLDQTIHDSHLAFRDGIFSKDPQQACITSLGLTQDAIELLSHLYTKQRITYRQLRTQRFPMFVGCSLTAPPVHQDHFLEAFNAVFVDTPWCRLEPEDGEYDWESTDRLVDWAVEQRLFVAGGPLIDLASDRFPAWIQPWKSDLVNMESFTADYVETVVSRYVGRIRQWEVACGANKGGACMLSEEQRLNLIVRAIEAAQQVDEQIQISLRVVQPWGEYLSTTENCLPPIQFVDTLRRSGVNISEVNLDIRFDDSPLASLHRDTLNLSQLLDHWSLLQMPLNVMATLPLPSEQLDSVSRVQWQIQQMEDMLLMCLSKERVTGFYCLNWANQDSANEPLVDADNCLHPVVSNFSALEHTHWPPSVAH